VICRRCDETFKSLKNIQEDRLETERQWISIANHGARLVLWIERKGLKVPGTAQLERMFPLESLRGLASGSARA
jgi:hypothetical protein